MKKITNVGLFLFLVLSLALPTTPALAAVTEVTNAGKLSLPADTEVGTVVKITDAITVSGAGTEEANGIYTERGTNNGKPYYNKVGSPDGIDVATSVVFDGGWRVVSEIAETLYLSEGDVAYPWLADFDQVDAGVEPFPVIVQYAYQSLAAPSEEVTAVFVSGAGTAEANGIYTERGGIENGKNYYNLLGYDDNVGTYAVIWESGQWNLYDGDSEIDYYSTDDTAFPWLAGGWTADGGGDPVPTFAPVTQGELDAGATVSGGGSAGVNSAYVRNGDQNGWPSYSNVSLPTGESNLYNVGSFNLAHSSDSWSYLSDDNPGLPWQTTYYTEIGDDPAPTVTRNDVASEANWVQADEPEEEVVVAEPEEEPSGGSSGSSRRKVVRKTGAVSETDAPTVITDVPTGSQDTNAASMQMASALSANPRDLEQNATGEDVRLLQRFLNARGFSVNAAGQPGSAGLETDFFGPLTRAALARFQAASGISPAAGYFGPITRAYIGSLGI